MARRFINQFGDREQVDDVFLAAEKQLRPNRQGNLYLQLRLSDRTGSITGMMWNAGEHAYKSFESGDYLRVEGKTQLYNGTLQIIVNDVERADASTIDENDFLQVTTQNIDDLAARLAEILRGIKNQHLRTLAECFLMDESFMSDFSAAPAAIKHHHAYRGGLLEHVVNLLELALLVGPRYPEIDLDLLLMGAFVHDMGKTEELQFDRDFAYTDTGQLIGHLVLGAEMLQRKIEEAEKLSGEPFPSELALRLKHMILSHHGQYDFGSPKLPMTLEAIALHYLDSLDAKVHSFHKLMEDDVNSDSPWTVYHPNLGRKLFKGE